MTQVPQASCKAVLLVLLVLLVASRAAETSEKQEEDQMEKRGQKQKDMMTLLKTLQARVAQLETQRTIRSRGYRGPGGVAYVRWGKTTCSGGASLVYKGRIGGEHYTHTGGGTNYVCLPENPRYVRYTSGHQAAGRMYGAEYERQNQNPLTNSYNLYHHDAPCAVCHALTRSAKIMIPATYVCPAGWTREYWGYLMSENYSHVHPTEYICVDKNAEYVPGSNTGHHGVLLYPVEGSCGSLPCLPYVNGRELTCAVCTK